MRVSSISSSSVRVGPAGETAGKNSPYFVYTGTMSEWQGADVFVRALPAVLAFRTATFWLPAPAGSRPAGASW